MSGPRDDSSGDAALHVAIHSALVTQLAESWGIESSGDDIEKLKEILAARVSEMLWKNHSKFMNALYRLDVSERKISEIFKTLSADKQPRALAEAILERELQKAKTRMASSAE